ncbi:nuclear apoptosis-inducing factor 1-like [Larimichthys crocea]|uniref:nuclear apoptosis-inducing factor 1-like n=1 Tax=Larimichthys crocea TaxID=215358 RepID=UPI000F5EA0AE|nr:nuclear apoptosis-inducing factor 1-like [Larimichthys crocea]
MSRGKKRNFTESELEVLINEVEMHREILFGTLSTGINAKRKRREWEHVCEAVNAVGSEQRTESELKKKWSDLKVEVKRRVSAHRRSVTATGGGSGVEELSSFDRRVASLVGDTALTGVVRAHEGDTDHLQDNKPGEDSSSGPGSSTGPGGSTPAADARPTGRVLTRAVLETQEQIGRPQLCAQLQGKHTRRRQCMLGRSCVTTCPPSLPKRTGFHRYVYVLFNAGAAHQLTGGCQAVAMVTITPDIETDS